MIKSSYKIILGSNSPRRNELLSGIDIAYKVRTIPDIDEDYPADMAVEKVPEYLAQKKAAAYNQRMTDDVLLITADTVVILDGKLYGKPTNDKDAKEMLHSLSGKTHTVITGVCLTTTCKQVTFSDVAFVTFSDISDIEIDYYLQHYSPLDKAGAYGVQEWIGYIAVERIEGSYFNVMGLPISKVYQALKEF
ncbi:MAG: Maf-like protein [Dysgonamonadaceae bacterium]|jgi:septum formation protein|nr:Maf-like protein [Dysgonamonadaceae bacterium]MDD3308689.1 Maf-like protein [Dysgonamonadaceae bacterium]MDD3901074.1 Maf-like protein [Dysgonamonadaceae bacterium]MDD4399629.1 Maf-like protein [Dysgonamonadaceae bacterium]